MNSHWFYFILITPEFALHCTDIIIRFVIEQLNTNLYGLDIHSVVK
jgi:hypothetical protein